MFLLPNYIPIVGVLLELFLFCVATFTWCLLQPCCFIVSEVGGILESCEPRLAMLVAETFSRYSSLLIRI